MSWGSFGSGFSQTFNPQLIGGAIREGVADYQHDKAYKAAQDEYDKSIQDIVDKQNTAENPVGLSKPAPGVDPQVSYAPVSVDGQPMDQQGGGDVASALDFSKGGKGGSSFPKYSKEDALRDRDAAMEKLRDARTEADIDREFDPRMRRQMRKEYEAEKNDRAYRGEMKSMYEGVMNGDAASTKKLMDFMNLNGAGLSMGKDGQMIGPDGKPFTPTAQQKMEALNGYAAMSDFFRPGGSSFSDYLRNAHSIAENRRASNADARAGEQLQLSKNADARAQGVYEGKDYNSRLAGQRQRFYEAKLAYEQQKDEDNYALKVLQTILPSNDAGAGSGGTGGTSGAAYTASTPSMDANGHQSYRVSTTIGGTKSLTTANMVEKEGGLVEVHPTFGDNPETIEALKAEVQSKLGGQGRITTLWNPTTNRSEYGVVGPQGAYFYGNDPKTNAITLPDKPTLPLSVAKELELDSSGHVPFVDRQNAELQQAAMAVKSNPKDPEIFAAAKAKVLQILGRPSRQSVPRAPMGAAAGAQPPQQAINAYGNRGGSASTGAPAQPQTASKSASAPAAGGPQGGGVSRQGVLVTLANGATRLYPEGTDPRTVAGAVSATDMYGRQIGSPWEDTFKIDALTVGTPYDQVGQGKVEEDNRQNTTDMFSGSNASAGAKTTMASIASGGDRAQPDTTVQQGNEAPANREQSATALPARRDHGAFSETRVGKALGAIGQKISDLYHSGEGKEYTGNGWQDEDYRPDAERTPGPLEGAGEKAVDLAKRQYDLHERAAAAAEEQRRTNRAHSDTPPSVVEKVARAVGDLYHSGEGKEYTGNGWQDEDYRPSAERTPGPLEGVAEKAIDAYNRGGKVLAEHEAARNKEASESRERAGQAVHDLMHSGEGREHESTWSADEDYRPDAERTPGPLEGAAEKASKWVSEFPGKVADAYDAATAKHNGEYDEIARAHQNELGGQPKSRPLADEPYDEGSPSLQKVGEAVGSALKFARDRMGSTETGTPPELDTTNLVGKESQAELEAAHTLAAKSGEARQYLIDKVVADLEGGADAGSRVPSSLSAEDEAVIAPAFKAVRAAVAVVKELQQKGEMTEVPEDTKALAETIADLWLKDNAWKGPVAEMVEGAKERGAGSLEKGKQDAEKYFAYRGDQLNRAGEAISSAGRRAGRAVAEFIENHPGVLGMDHKPELDTSGTGQYDEFKGHTYKVRHRTRLRRNRRYGDGRGRPGETQAPESRNAPSETGGADPRTYDFPEGTPDMQQGPGIIVGTLNRGAHAVKETAGELANGLVARFTDSIDRRAAEQLAKLRAEAKDLSPDEAARRERQIIEEQWGAKRLVNSLAELAERGAEQRAKARSEQAVAGEAKARADLEEAHADAERAAQNRKAVRDKAIDWVTRQYSLHERAAAAEQARIDEARRAAGKPKRAPAPKPAKEEPRDGVARRPQPEGVFSDLPSVNPKRAIEYVRKRVKDSFTKVEKPASKQAITPYRNKYYEDATSKLRPSATKRKD